ncbi:hypothetical protein TNCV_5020641 [Trichonephila clavipes]|nr:hypothetical protein TNCV_5020641 [Trichonephila clavipes]
MHSVFAAWGILNSSMSSREVGGRGREVGCPWPLNWGGTEPNRTVTYMVLKATDNDRRNISPTTMNFVCLDLMLLQIRRHQ